MAKNKKTVSILIPCYNEEENVGPMREAKEDTYVFPKLELKKPNQDQEPLLNRRLYVVVDVDVERQTNLPISDGGGFINYRRAYYSCICCSNYMEATA
jgi:cellulose synthase/poly-beta-1,6-N-acetylglucosamine synthase-like glycosyltransferase